MKYHLISASLLGAAFALETLGFAGGGVVLLGAGVGCEVWFLDEDGAWQPILSSVARDLRRQRIYCNL